MTIMKRKCLRKYYTVTNVSKVNGCFPYLLGIGFLIKLITGISQCVKLEKPIFQICLLYKIQL